MLHPPADLSDRLLTCHVPPQATLNGMLSAALFFFISQAKPREVLSATRPYPSIFNPYFFISLLGQFRWAQRCQTFCILGLKGVPAAASETRDEESAATQAHTRCFRL